MDANLFDIIIGKISFIIHRQSNSEWSRNITNDKNFLMIFASKGRALYTVDNQIITVSAGDMLFFNKGQPHSGVSDIENPWAYYTVAFDVHSNDAAPVKELPFPMLTHLSNPEIFLNLMDMLYNEWGAQNPGFELGCRGIICECLCRLIRENKTGHKQSQTIEKIKKYMIANFTKDLSTEELAKMANVSKPHFHRLFKENTGISAKQYIIRVRMNRAKALLESGEHNITEVAQLLGYDDIYYFSRLFRKVFGVTPSALILKKGM